MILDNYWKSELRKMIHRLSFWSYVAKIRVIKKYAEHQINKSLLLSGAIVRKILEDEMEFVKFFNSEDRYDLNANIIPKKDNKLGDYQIDCLKMDTIEDKESLFLVNATFSLYNYTNVNEKYSLKLHHVCNQIIHSYVWAIVYDEKKVYGFVTASDKCSKKVCYIISITDWNHALRHIIENANI